MSNPVLDMTGRKFGYWTVVERRGVNKRREMMWTVECICGTRKQLSGPILRQGRSQCCGCKTSEMMIKSRTTHNQTHVRSGSWRSWRSLLARTRQERRKYSYIYFGKLDDPRWNRFENFYADMGERPSPKHSIDRIDGTKGYSKENCRWATSKEQIRNRRVTRWVTYQGRTQCLKDWADEVGLSSTTLRGRLNSGWPIENAFNILPTRFHSRLMYNRQSLQKGTK